LRNLTIVVITTEECEVIPWSASIPRSASISWSASIPWSAGILTRNERRKRECLERGHLARNERRRRDCVRGNSLVITPPSSHTPSSPYTAELSIVSYTFGMLSLRGMPGWRNGRRYGLKIR
jgi:hypothetical protein